MTARSPRAVLIVEDPRDLPDATTAASQGLELDFAIVPAEWRLGRRPRPKAHAGEPGKTDDPNDPNPPLRPYFPDPGIYNITMSSGRSADIAVNPARLLNLRDAARLSPDLLAAFLDEAPSIIVAQRREELEDASELIRRVRGAGDHAQRHTVVVWLVRQAS